MKKIKDCETLHNKLKTVANKLIESEDNIEDLKIEFNELFNELFDKSIVDEYFWDYCTSDVYSKFYEQRKKEYFKRFINIPKEKDFIDDESGKLKRLEKIKDQNKVYYLFNSGCKYGILFNDIIDTELLKKIQLSQKYKYEFLENKKKNITIEKTNLENVANQNDLLDFSDNSGAEKLVFLHRLGILDYLRMIHPVNTSINKLAETLSTFTGLKSGSIQSSLNAIFNEKTSQHNNPLKEKNTKKVDNKLLNIGFDLEKKPFT